MGTVERGESNLSFQNIAKVAATLGVSLSVLFADLEARAEAIAAKPTGAAVVKPRERSSPTKQTASSTAKR